MSQKPLILVCTSCHANIEVRNLSLVGQIVPCPKCGSMILVEFRAEHAESPHEPLESEQKIVPDNGIDSLFHDDSPTSEPETSGEKIEAAIVEENLPKQESEISGTKKSFDFVGKIFRSWHAKWKPPFLSILKKLNPQNKRAVWVLLGIVPLLLLALLIFVAKISRPAKSIETASQISGQVKEPPAGISASPNVDSPDRDTAVSPEQNQDGSANPAVHVANAGTDETGSASHPDVAEKQHAPETKSETTTPAPGETTPSESLLAKIEDVGKATVDDKKPETEQKSSETGSSGLVRMGSLPEAQKTVPSPMKSDPPQPPPVSRSETESPTPTESSMKSPTEQSTTSGETKSSDVDNKNTGETVAGQANDEKISERKNEPKSVETDIDEGNDIAKMRHEPIPALPRKKMDIDARLSLPVMTFQVEKKAIINVLRTLSDLTGVPMQLDVDELRARGISVEAPVTLQLKETNVAGIIAALLEKTHLTTRRGDSNVVFSYTEEQMAATSTVRYDLSRLAKLEKNPISAQQAADWMTQLLFDQKNNPKTRNGGIAVDGNEIVVIGNAWLQDQANRLYLSFHYLRGIEPETKLSPEQIAPEVFGWDRVHESLTLNLIEPKPLKDAARLVENGAKIRVLIDHAALWSEGLSQASMVSVHVNQGTVDQVLLEMLQPLGLTYRIVEANAIEITTPKAAAEKMTIEIQKYAPLESDKTPESCVDTIKQMFGRERWNNGAGGTDSGGKVVIDSASGYLLVRQSQPLQREIRQWLGQLHAALEDGNSGNEEKTPPSRVNESETSKETQKADSAKIQLQFPAKP